MAENTNKTSENQEELSKKDFHEIMMKQYELLNSQFNTIRQLQIDNEERSAEFDFTRLIPGFLRKKKNNAEKTENNSKKGVLSRFFNFSILSIAKSFKIVVALTLLGFILGIVFYSTSDRNYLSKIKYSSGALGNSFFAGQIENLGTMAKSASNILAERLNIPIEEAEKIKNIDFQVYTQYVATRKKIINDSTIVEQTYYPFFEVLLTITDNSVLPIAEQKLTEYLSNNQYIENRLSTMASGIKSQVEDLSKQITNMDSLTSAAIHRIKNTNENQFFVKETGIDGKGIILNQGEPVNGIINSIINDTKITSAKKGLLTEQLADIDNDKFALVEHFSASNTPFFPRLRTIVFYTLYGLALGIIIAFTISIWKAIVKKVNDLEKSEASN
ncbi:MAG: hypothetical protein PUC50_09785 [Bacteroidales bacterium]|nr:hypothetical protein [Bacteroidales bacterium]